MAFTGSYLCDSFLLELLTGTHNFTNGTGDTFKMALYTSSASLTNLTTAYSATNEISGTGYSAGGAAMTTVTPAMNNGFAIADFLDQTWAASAFTARGALIYNSSKSNKAVAVLDFGAEKTSSVGNPTFTVQMPTADYLNAIVKIGRG